jgi:hypothetical protein
LYNFLINCLNKENNFYERMKTMGLIAGSALEQKNKWVFYFWSLPHLAIIPIEGAVLFELGAHRQKYSHNRLGC